MRQLFCLLAAVCLCYAPAAFASAEQPTDRSGLPRIDIDHVVALGPLPISSQQLADTDKGDELRRALVEYARNTALPRDGLAINLFGRSLTWRQLTVEHRDDARPAAEATAAPWLWMMQLETDRFVTGHLEIEGLNEVRVFHGADTISSGDKGHELVLRNGTHTIWLVHQGPEKDQAPRLTWHGKTENDRVVAHTRPERRVSPELLTNAETVSSMAISPDGRFLALAFDSRRDAADLDLRRLEIRDLSDNQVVRQWTSNRPRALAWSPDSRFLAVHEGDNLWLHEWPRGEARLLLANHEHIGAFRWHPDSASILFNWTEPYKDENPKARRLRALEDRQDTFRDNSQLYQVEVEHGVVRPLTSGSRSLSLQDIHPDGDRLLVSERVIDYAEPPHMLFRLFTLSLDDLEQHDIGRFRYFNSALFADEGYWLLAGPGLSVGDGVTTGEELTPNAADTQLYRLAADGASARSVSRDLAPALGSVHRLPGGDLLLSAIDAEHVTLLRFDRARESFAALDTGVELMESFVVSEGRRPVAVLRGTDADRPQRVHLVALHSNRNRTLLDSQPSQYSDVRFGRVTPWTFTNDSGDEIDGRYYLPPDFDPARKYPLIVYYYGGITPVNRQFTGRYPFNLWAAQGYVIYVLQPRGAIGYGQEFSARHVNAWGQYSADDIIEGTQKFVAAHEFIDAERIGNIGASYGGFMTMHLATLTDLYTASISHAGISALTSYWGQGWWGFSYSGIASRDSFPWNNPELYVGQSPVYSADQVTTPLLLLTGDSDTNVPPGESHNMFTALKLLDREVELIEFPGENHWILDREQRYVWWDTMLAWFDRWLKDQPEWWHHLYPETKD